MVSSQEPESQLHEGEVPASSFYQPYARDFAASGSPVSAKDSAKAGLRKQASQDEMRIPSPKRGEILPAQLRLSQARPVIPSTNDQENEIPHGLGILSKPFSIGNDLDKKPIRPLVDVGVQPVRAAAASPERKALGQMSKNTPHRAAPPPPPPKMTVLETATATAGAATAAQAKKQRILLKVNGRSYQRVDIIGRGGTSKVYKVSAENGKMFALKRVSLENTDETTIKGYLGEIDLLKKLAGVDRVIQFFDFELNQERQLLSVVSYHTINSLFSPPGPCYGC